MILMRLAIQRERQRPHAAADIAREQGVSLSHMEAVLAALRRAGFVQSVRGPGGGYLLARPAEEISVAEILDCVDRRAPAPAAPANGPRQPWDVLSDRLHGFLGEISLAEAIGEPAVAAFVQPARRVAAR
jgi:Rrf2 family iron-sulfur cluster assembly transcriptional regulator